MAQWVGAQGQVNVAKNTPTCGVPPRKPPPQTKNVFFDFDYKTCWIRRGFEQLSSSTAWRVVGLQTLHDKWYLRDLKGETSFFPQVPLLIKRKQTHLGNVKYYNEANAQ